MPSSPLRAAFDLPPARALEFFRAKGLATSFSWRDMLHEEHDRDFTVAKMADLDLLADVRRLVDRGLAEGWTRARFIRDLRPELMRRGWWGQAMATDPDTGEEKLVQLGSARRLKTIFDTNLRTSYAAGHWAAIEKNARAAPYVMYSAVLDSRTRPMHRAWNGTVLRWNDPWWQTHTPPNGWNCRCSVIQLSARDLRRLGKDGPDSAPPSNDRDWINPRTGEILRVPAGVDPGWGYAPGASTRAQLLGVARDKAEAAPADLSAAFLSANVQGQFRTWWANPAGEFPVGRLDDALADAIGARTRVPLLSAQTLAKNREAHPEVTLEEYLRLPEIIEAGLAIQDSPVSLVLVREIERRYFAALKATRSGEAIYVTSLRRMDRPQELERLKRRGKVLREEQK